MVVDDLLVEAKLTESDFQSARFDLIHRYRDLETVFDVTKLPVRNDRYNGYQLIRPRDFMVLEACGVDSL